MPDLENFGRALRLVGVGTWLKTLDRDVAVMQ